VVIALGDQPMISADVIDKMVDSFVSRKKGIIIPVSGGKRGHPLLIAQSYFSEITGMDDDSSLRNILMSHEEDILELEVGTDDILRDIDTIEDYKKEIHK
jgi:molybdenum cofactor cytidylyltransferase